METHFYELPKYNPETAPSLSVKVSDNFKKDNKANVELEGTDKRYEVILKSIKSVDPSKIKKATIDGDNVKFHIKLKGKEDKAAKLVIKTKNLEHLLQIDKLEIKNAAKQGNLDDLIRSRLGEFLFFEELLKDGKTIKTEIPLKFYSGNTDEAKALLKNLTELRENLISQIPKIPIDFNAPVGAPGTFYDNDNYVFYPKAHPDVKLPEKAAQFKTIDTKGGIVLGTDIYCDAGLSLSGKGFCINSLNDGSNWGNKVKKAANDCNKLAATSLHEELSTLQTKNNLTSRDIIRAQDNALFKAQEELGKVQFGGTTCPLLSTIAGNKGHFTMAGDCGAVVISGDLSAVKEPTLGNRGGVNPTDPGGRFGPYVGGKDADLRNYTHMVTELKSQDIVIMFSDGIHDNFDPEMLGMSPQDLNLTGKEWEANNKDHVDARSAFKGEKIRQVLQEYKIANKRKTLSSEDVNNAIWTFVQNSSLDRKLYMLENGRASSEPPSDHEGHKKWPGKMDHAGCLVYMHP